MNAAEPLTPESGALNEALLRLHEAMAKRRSQPVHDVGTFEAMRSAARKICGGIQAVCNSGGMVVVRSARGSHRTHEIRKVGVLCNELLLTCSTNPNAGSCDHHCILTDTSRFEAMAETTPTVSR